jgi:hypothetical protein
MPTVPFVPLGVPLMRQIKNGILQSKNAMPQKDITSDGASTYSLGRKLFQKTAVQTTNTVTIGQMVIQRKALGLGDQQSVMGGKATSLQKRWIGGNRDSSNVTKIRGIRAIGKTELNPAGTPVAFKNVVDRNTQRQALRRVRHVGSAAPAQKTHKYKNAPVFY